MRIFKLSSPNYDYIHFLYIANRSPPTLQDLCLRSIASCDAALPIDLLPNVFQCSIIQFALNRHSTISFTTSADNRMFILFSSQLQLPNETMWSNSFIFPAATLVHLQSISFYQCNLLTELGSVLLANSGLTSLKSLSVRTCPLVTDEILVSLLSVQHNLESLTLKKLIKIDGRCLRSLSSCSHSLKELHLRKLRGLQPKILVDTLRKISFPALTLLDIGNGPTYSSNEISSIIKYLAPSPLVTLSFARSFMNLVDEHVEAIARAHSRTLEALDMSECSNISWKSIASLLRDCRQLHSLDIRYCTQLAFENPKEIASTLRAAAQRLRYLNLTSLLQSISPTATNQIIEGVTALQSIQDLRLCGSMKLTDEMVELLCKSLGGSLRKLDISSAPELTLRSVAHALRHCERLEALFFVCLVPFVRPTQDSLAALSACAATLEELRERSDDGLALRRLWLTNTQISGPVLSQLVQLCPALEELDVSAIKTVTDDLLLQLSTRRPPLRFLNLKACTQVTDKGICELVAACGSTLDSLVLSGLNQLTDASLVTLAAHALNLRKVYADGCTRLSLRAFIHLKKSVRGEFAVHHWLPPRSSRMSAVPATDAFEAAELEAARCSSWYSNSSNQHPARLARLSLAGYQFLRFRHALSDLLHPNIPTSLHVPFRYVLLAALFLSVSLVVWRIFS